MIEFFLFTLYFYKKEQDLELLVDDTYKYLQENNIYYAEIFWAPTGFRRNGLDFSKMLNVLTNCIESV